jgi:hypothetical protein
MFTECSLNVPEDAVSGRRRSGRSGGSTETAPPDADAMPPEPKGLERNDSQTVLLNEDEAQLTVGELFAEGEDDTEHLDKFEELDPGKEVGVLIPSIFTATYE